MDHMVVDHGLIDQIQEYHKRSRVNRPTKRIGDEHIWSWTPGRYERHAGITGAV